MFFKDWKLNNEDDIRILALKMKTIIGVALDEPGIQSAPKEDLSGFLGSNDPNSW